MAFSLNSGALVLYHGKFAAVTAINKEKIEIRIEGGAAKSVRPKDVEFLHRGPVSVLPPKLLPEPDCAELLELMEGETLPFREFLLLAYSADTPEAAASAWELISRNIWFRGSPEEGVTGRSPEEVAAALAIRDAKADEKAAREALLERIRSGAVLPEDRVNLREIEQVALGNAPSSRLLRDLGIEATPEKAHQLLLRLGVWDFLTDPWPSRAGIELTEPDCTLAPLPDEERVDLTAMTAYAIDDEGSDDPDDAVSFADGLVWVHVADPAASVTPECDADNEAAARGENLYLPEKVVHMLPPEATERFGLGLQPVSPALSFGIRIAPDGAAHLEQMVLSTVRVERLTYHSAGERWEEEPLSSLRRELERFRERRRADGALFIQLPEVKLRVVDGTVQITPCFVTPERELVANAMLAAGSAVAGWAAEREIPMPFVAQVPPEAEPGGGSMVEMFALRRACAPSTVQCSPGRHAGLALEPYVRVTSPLRRYADLLAHQQLRRVLKKEELLSADWLESRLVLSEAAALERRRLERTVNEYWTLVYLAQHPEWTGRAVLVDRQDDRLTFLVPELAYEYKNRFGGRVNLGEELEVRLAAVDPAALIARMRIESRPAPAE